MTDFQYLLSGLIQIVPPIRSSRTVPCPPIPIVPAQPLAPRVMLMVKACPESCSDPATCTEDTPLKSAMALARICLAVSAASGLPDGPVEPCEPAGPEGAELPPQPAAARTASRQTAIVTRPRGMRMGDKLPIRRGPDGPDRDHC